MKTTLLSLAIAMAFPLAARAQITLAPGFEIHGSLGGRAVSDYDVADFSGTGATYDWGSNFEGGVWTGYRWGAFGLEGGIGFGPYRRNTVALDSVTTLDVAWDQLSYEMAATFSVPSQFAWFGPYVNTFGIGMGYGMVNGRVTLQDASTGDSGYYDQSAQGFFGPDIFYRGEQFLSDNVSFDFQIGYRFARFTPVATSNVSGNIWNTFAPPPSPDQNANGSNLVIDNSGLYLGVGLTVWFQQPWTGKLEHPAFIYHPYRRRLVVVEPAPDDGQAEAPPSNEANIEASEKQANFGETFLNDGKYEDAISAFDLAVQSDPDNLRAWKGLGKAYALEGNTAQATRVYRRVLSINPDDAEAHRYLDNHAQ